MSVVLKKQEAQKAQGTSRRSTMKEAAETRQLIEKGDTRTIAKRIGARFPKVMARLAE